MQKSRAPDGKPKPTQFTINVALLEELGERLVSRPDVALAELIKNAFDADSPDCNISIARDEITVSDHGHGMTESEFLSNWMVVSSPSKGIQRYSRRYHRSMAGSKGVGRFSARFLGKAVTLTSVADDASYGIRTKLTAHFDWDKISRGQDITTINIEYRINEAPGERCGTILEITGLRREARNISTWKVKTDVLRLTTPLSGLESPAFARPKASRKTERPEDPGFSVTFAGDDGDDDAIPASVQAEIVDAYVGRVRLAVNEAGTVSYAVYWRNRTKPLNEGEFDLKRYCSRFLPERLQPKNGEKQDDRGLTSAVASVKNLPLAVALHSPVFIDLRFFPKRKGTFRDLSVNGVTAQAWIREHASVAVVDNGFAMNAYGTDSDWLGVDASKANNERHWQSIFTPILFPMSEQDRSSERRNPMLALPRGSQLIGRVHVATRKRVDSEGDDSEDWLQPNMDRESLRDNGAFRVLWHLSRFAVELLAHFDRKIRLKQEAAADAARSAATKTALSKAIAEVKSSDAIEPEYRARIVEQLRSIEDRYQEAEEYDRTFQQSLELMSMMGVIAGFMTHEFEKAMRALSEIVDLVRDIARKDRRMEDKAAEIESLETSLAHYMDYMRLFINRARDPKRQRFKARAQVTAVVETMASLAAAHGIDVEVDIANKLPGPYVPIAAYHGVVANLVSNAMKALVPKTTGGQRKVRIYATNDDSKHVLVCVDNGIGIPEFLKDRIWDPLYTTTAKGEDDNPLGSGLGLGLSVVRDVVKGLKGSIELMEEAPPGFVTAFRVQMPLE